ncbi:Guanine nucleotide-binding proteinalpha-17 subunit [Aphelenchoides besseyi]|nr:Guanine nucleotide-binding proteinalpha-17 subunit [Aphelenchoides besseyi]
MGHMQSCQNLEVRRQIQRSRAIDRQLHESSNRYVQKLLLLGPGESGKSTCVKQMQILHAKGFCQEELRERKSLIYSNTLRTVMEICDLMQRLPIRFVDPNNNEVARRIFKYVEGGMEFNVFSTEIRDALQKIWDDPAFKEVIVDCGQPIEILQAFTHSNLCQCNDSAQHFLNSLDRISRPDYLPTNEDVLFTRVPTTGVVKFSFEFQGLDFLIVDVGGQRSERRKWIHCFDDVNALIYVCAVNEYDQRLREDDKTNRLVEAMNLFKNVVNTSFFEKTSMILFLNKIDLFKEKIQRVPLSVTFASYKGGLNYADGISFIRRQFLKLYHNESKIYVHETCATDTSRKPQGYRNVVILSILVLS